MSATIALKYLENIKKIKKSLLTLQPPTHSLLTFWSLFLSFLFCGSIIFRPKCGCPMWGLSYPCSHLALVLFQADVLETSVSSMTFNDFSVFIHIMGMTDELPHGASESHTSEVSQGCGQCGSDLWGQDWWEWSEQSGSQSGPTEQPGRVGKDKERDRSIDYPGPVWTSCDQPP